MFSKCPCKHDVQYSKTHKRVNDSRYIPIWKTSSLQTFTHACMVKNYVDITGNLSNMSMICLQYYNVNNIYIYTYVYMWLVYMRTNKYCTYIYIYYENGMHIPCPHASHQVGKMHENALCNKAWLLRNKKGTEHDLPVPITCKGSISAPGCKLQP